MNFPSKDDSLKHSIANMNAVLAEVGCKTTFSHEKHPLEHCYSVNLTSHEAPQHIYANGKGINSEASIASALGEYIERLQTNNFFTDFHLPNRQYYPDEVVFDFNGAYLNEDLRKIYDPQGELSSEDLVDYNSDYLDKIVALPFIEQSSGNPTYIPVNILNNLYVSNGLATGNSPYEAQVQALSEIFERYAKIEIIKNGYALPKYPDEAIKSFTKLREDITALRKLGFIVEVLDASLGGKFPVTAISLINPKNSSLFVSFGAHPILEVALERTMTELMQGRDLNNLDAFETPTFDMDFVADSFNLESHFIDSNGKLGFGFLSTKKSFDFKSWDYQGTGCQAECNYLRNILSGIDKELYLREYSYLGFYSCQIIVPAISEIYPIEDLTYNNRNQGKWIRNLVLNFEDYDPKEILNAVDHLDDSLNIDQYIGVLFQDSFTMLEFKAQMYLLLGNFDEAFATLEFSETKLSQIICELIRMTEKELPWEEYEEGLINIFGIEDLGKATRILSGETFLINTTFHKDYLNMLSLYDKLDLKKQLIKNHR